MPQVGPYEILRELGQGGMGRVFAARDTRLGRDVALKVLKGAVDETDLGRFRREAQALAKLRHPGIVAVFDLGEVEGQPYFAMELVEGSTLHVAVERKQLSTRERVEVIRQAADAVGFAHRQGVLHRDLKPTNILVAPGLRAKVLDFGLAKILESAERGGSVTGTALGTPAYMSPEQARGAWGEVDARTDIWGLGATLYHALTGAPPFEGSSIDATLHLVTEQEPPPPSRINLEVDADLETICLKCLEKEAGKRYASAGDLAKDLGRWLSRETIAARRPRWTEKAWKWTRRRRGWIAGIVLTMAAAAVAGTLALEKGRENAAARRRESARTALASGDWERALLEAGSDPELRTIAEEAREQIRRRKARAGVRDRVQPLEAIIRDTRALFYAGEIDLAKKLAAVETAVDELEKLLSDPEGAQVAEAWVAIGMGRYVIGDAGTAEEALLRAIRLESRDNRVPFYLSRIYFERAMTSFFHSVDETSERRAARAREWTVKAESFAQQLDATTREVDRHLSETYRVVLSGDPKELRARCDEGLARFGDTLGTEEYWLLRALAVDGRERVESCEAAVRRRPHYAMGYFMRGWFRGQEGDRDGAIQDYTAAIRVNPRMAEAWLNRGIEVSYTDPDAAISDIERALVLRGDLPEAFNARASVRLRRGEYDLAMRDFSEAIRLQPSWAGVWANRSQARRQRGDRSGAMEDADEAIRIDPKYSGGFENRGLAKRALGNLPGAKQDIDRAIALDSRNPSPYVSRAAVNEDFRDYPAAFADYETALRLSPNFAAAYGNRAQLKELLEDFDGAMEDFARALRLTPRDANLYYNRGNLREKRKDHRGAVEDYSSAIGLQRNASNYTNGGIARRNLREFELAIQDFDEAIRIDPKMLIAYANRGDCKREMGDRAGAIADFERVLELAPEDWFGRTAVEKALRKLKAW